MSLIIQMHFIKLFNVLSYSMLIKSSVSVSFGSCNAFGDFAILILYKYK